MKTYKLGFPFFCLLCVVSLFSCAIIAQEDEESLCYLYKLKKPYEGLLLYRYKDGKLSSPVSAGHDEDGAFIKVVDSFYTRAGDYEGIVVSSIPFSTDGGKSYLPEYIKIENIIDFDPILEVWEPYDKRTRNHKELIEEGLGKNYKRVK